MNTTCNNNGPDVTTAVRGTTGTTTAFARIGHCAKCRGIVRRYFVRTGEGWRADHETCGCRGIRMITS